MFFLSNDCQRKMFSQLIIFRLFNFICLALLLKLSLILCAPLSKEESCTVKLVPNKIISKRYQESTITISCEAQINSEQLFVSTNVTHFSNPVFDLSFGGAPRTGIFIIRGNVTCDGKRTKCWSEFKLAANSIGNLIQHSGNIEFSCQVADQLRNAPINKELARCENKGYIGFSNVLKYGDSCSTEDIEQECGINMKCGTSETEKESEPAEQCVCNSGFVSIPLAKNTICVEEAVIESNCNYTKQCATLDPNSVCEKNDLGVKVCQCNKDSYLYSEYKTDYKKACLIKPLTTKSPSSEDSFDVIFPNNEVIESNTEEKQDINKSEELIEENESLMNKTKDSKSKNKSSSTTNAGIVFFFLAILLAILIVVIIIRVRNKSQKMTVNKKRGTTEQQTDAKDGEQTTPMLSEGTDEVDDQNNKQTQNNGVATQNESPNQQNPNIIVTEENNNKTNNINSNEKTNSQKIQTNV